VESKLFEPFQRLHDAPACTGSGMGLVIVKRIVDRRPGDVVGRGRGGQGATFYFTLGVGC